jgi:hypothetical protein
MPAGGVIGNKAGIVVVPAITIASHRYTFFWQNVTSGAANVGGSEFPFGWKNFSFQLVPGNMSAGSVEIDVTIELLTAQGTNSNWEPVPAQNAGSGNSWYNPLTNFAGQRLLQVNSGPWLAFSALTSSDYNGTTAYLIAAATA